MYGGFAYIVIKYFDFDKSRAIRFKHDFFFVIHLEAFQLCQGRDQEASSGISRVRVHFWRYLKHFFAFLTRAG